MHSPGIYSAKLDELTDIILAMGAHVQEALEISGRALVRHEEELRQEARQLDKKINRLTEELEEQVISLFTRAAPLASDLRYVVAVLKAAIALERAGDLAKSITKHMARLQVPFREHALEALQELVAVNQRMLETVLQSVRTRDADLALAAWKMDDEADDACDRVFEIIRDEMTEEPEAAGQLTDLMFAAKNYERMADYCADIAKMVIYVATGERPHKDILKQD